MACLDEIKTIFKTRPLESKRPHFEEQILRDARN